MSATLPDYSGGGLLNLVASLAAARGGRPVHRTAVALPPADIEDARNIVLLLVDGLGHDALKRAGPGLALARDLRCAVTSVFPSTTAAAITTSFSGLAPAGHGLTAWHVHFAAAHGVVAPLPFRTRGTDRPLGELGIAPADIYPPRPLLDTLTTAACVVTPGPIADSEYSRHCGGRARRRGYADLAGLVRAVETEVRADDARKFIYAYYADYDATSHRFGVASPQAAAELAAVDAAFAELRVRLAGTDTVIVATADHGFIDSTPDERLVLESFPMLAELLRLPLCGEPRVAFCHVVPGRVNEFIGRAAEALAGKADVHRSRDLFAAGWFGPGSAHPQLDERIGDVALVMRSGCILRDSMPGEKRHVLIGNHGGVSQAEMLIPLVVTHV